MIHDFIVTDTNIRPPPLDGEAGAFGSVSADRFTH